MIDAERLKERMKAVGISQSALGREVGMSQQAVHKLISGATRRTPNIARIARVLRTTPAYLERETDDPTSDFPDDLLSAEERDWIEWLRRTPADQRRALLRLAESLAGAPPAPVPPTLHDKRHTYRGKNVA